MAAPAPSPSAADPAYCDQCGEPSADDGAHSACVARRGWEPPRYCAACRRRMVVQVTPAGWRAQCAEHGQFRSA